MKIGVTVGVLVGTINTFNLNLYQQIMAMKYQQSQLSGVDQLLNSKLTPAEQSDVLLNVNDHSTQMGYSPIELLLGKVAPAKDLAQYMKDGIEGSIRKDLHETYNNPLTDVLLPYAKTDHTHSRASAETLEPNEVFAQYITEPMRTIMLLKTHPNTQVRARGANLMKKAIARCAQFSTAEEREKCREKNPVASQSSLIDMLVDGDKDGMKRFMAAKAIQDSQPPPLQQAFAYRAFSGTNTGGSLSSNADLLKYQFAGETLAEELEQVAPNDAYLMFKFIHGAAAADQGRIPANVILDIAFGSDIMDIKASEFKQNFGVSANDYICAVHDETLRVPCLVNQATVTQPMCAELGCCYNRMTDDGSAHVNPANTPICYHNVLGKVGAGIARHMIKKENVVSLFGGIQHWPKLDELSEAQSWAETQMPDVLQRMVKEPGSYYGTPRGQHDWWGNMYNSKEKVFNIFAQHEDNFHNSNSYRSRNFEWKPHGPTAMPGAASMNIPEIGGYVSGSDARAKDLDFVIGHHINLVRGQLNSQSYTCQLIAKEHMNDCFPHNYAALSTEKDGKAPAAACEEMGCCYNELNFFADELLPVCYRSLRSGYCDSPINERGTGTRQDKYWDVHPFREECGEPGVARFECLKKNPYCCFDTNPRRDGDPFCYRRGGVESQINPYTRSKGEAIDECLTIPLTLRQNCFYSTSKWGKLLNRMATEDQCNALGCCYDQAAADAAAKLGLFGSMSLAAPHCYKGPEDLDHKFTNSNYRQLPRVNIGDLLKVCANDPKWPKLNQRKWVQGADGRMSLQSTSHDRPLSRSPCLDKGQRVFDRHKCIYTLNCCFEKSANPIDPWCYQARTVKA